MGKILRPGSEDADYAAMLSKDVPVRLRKVQKDGTSYVHTGAEKSGHLTEPLAKGRPAVFREANQGNTSDIQELIVNDAGDIAIRTATSMYKVLSSSADYRQKSLLYLRRGYLDFDEKMPDGFYDGGRFMEFEEDAQGTVQFRAPSGREIILMDSSKDEGLKKKLEAAQQMLKDVHDPKSKILLLAQFVSNVMGGIQTVGTPTTTDSDKEIEAWMKTQGNVLLPGYLNHGVCRHRSVVFKYMADRLGIRSRLIRGETSGAHVWNIVEIGKEFFIIDVMQNPFQLIPTNDPRAVAYKRTGANGVGRGTAGGGSIPVK